jgi:hypothetical protein
MKRSVASPELWAIALKIPTDMKILEYRYIIFTTSGEVYVEALGARKVDLLNSLHSGRYKLSSGLTEIEHDDMIEKVSKIGNV